MSTNLFARLKSLLPDSPVLVGRVMAHHVADDTSTVLLPTQQGSAPLGGNLATGSYLRARGTTVAVGDNAFVRDGVIETQAPDTVPIVIKIGTTVAPASTLVFSGPIANQSLEVSVPFTLNLAGYWSGGTEPYTWAVMTGTLPTGLTLNAATGTVSGTPTTAQAAAGVVFTATDAAGATAASNAPTFTVEAAREYLVLARFDGSLANEGTLGGSFTLESPAALVTSDPWQGSGALSRPGATVSGGAFIESSGLVQSAGTPLSVSGRIRFGASGAPWPTVETVVQWRCANTYTMAFSMVPDGVGGLAIAGLSSGNFVPVAREVWHHFELSVAADRVQRWFWNGRLLDTGLTMASTEFGGTFRYIGLTVFPLTSGGAGVGGGHNIRVDYDNVVCVKGAAHTTSFTPPIGPA